MRISKLGGNVDYGSIKTNLESVFFDLYGKFSGEGTGEQKIAWVDQMINVAEEWVSAVQESIRMQYEPAIEANNTEIETLNKQLQVLRQWQTLNDSLKKTILDLSTSLSSPADVMERVGIAQGEVDRLTGLYAGATGEQKAGYGTELETAFRDLLTVGQEAYQRPSIEYQNLFEYVISALQQMESDSSGYADQAKTADERIAFLTEDNNRLQGLMQADLDGIQGTITEASNWLAQAVIAAYDLRSGEIVTEISKDQSALKSVIGDLTVGTYIEQLKTATVTELQAIKGLLEQQWGTTGLPNPGETAANTGGGGGSGGEAGGTGGTSGGGTGGGVEKFIGQFGGGSVYPPEYWGMTFTQGNEGRWKQVVQEALESLGFSPSAMLSNLSADNRALVLNEYADLLSSVYSFLANQTAPFTVPSYQSGTDYVPRTGLAFIHEGEQIFPKGQSKNNQTINVTISPQVTINASGDASPKEIARETRRELLNFMRYDVGREVIKEIARSVR
jgi:hypothetical protein